MNKEKSINMDAVLTMPKNTFFKHPQLYLAIGCAIFSYCFIRFTHPFHMGISDALILFLFLTFIVIFCAKSYPLHKHHFLWITFMYLSLIPNILYENYMLKFFNYGFIIVLCIGFLNHATHKQITADYRKFFLLNLIHSIFYYPMKYLKKAFTALQEAMHATLHIRHFTGILIGCILSIPILLVVIPLLSSADDAFQMFIYNIFHNLDELIVELLYFAFAIPIFCYLYPMLYIHFIAERNDIVYENEDSLDTYVDQLASVPSSIPLTIEVILILVYSIFLFMTCMEIIQNAHLPLSDFSYSEFARRGFFELCIISLINGVVITFVQIFSSQKDTKIFKVIKFILCILTIGIIFTAMFKMVLYISCYGLTPLRIYSSWAMILLFGIFTIVIYHTLKQKPHLFYHIAVYFALCFFLLNAMNVNGIINYYNTTMPIQQNITY